MEDEAGEGSWYDDAWWQSDDVVTSATDKYQVTANGDYSIRAYFTSTEWKKFPVDVTYQVTGIKSHSYQTKVTAATTKKDGSTYKKCKTCGNTEVTSTISKIASVELAQTSYNATGKAIKPSVTVKDSKGHLVLSKYYTVSYKNNKSMGKATATVTFKGNYSGTVNKSFTIQMKKGATFTSGNYKYKVTGVSEVAFAGLKSNSTTKVTIPKTVSYKGVTYKVTSMADKALKGTKVTNVTVGANVTSIGKYAFQNCKSLKKLTFKTTKLTTVGTYALKGARENITIVAPTYDLLYEYGDLLGLYFD
jgi:hypothetical protein